LRLFVDYFICSIFFVDKLLAGIAGTLFGGILNFIISRHWVFKVKNIAFSKQGKRYFITWLGNLILNSAGLYLLIKLFNVQYIIAKIIISCTVAITYNYPVQKRYVFKISD